MNNTAHVRVKGLLDNGLTVNLSGAHVRVLDEKIADGVTDGSGRATLTGLSRRGQYSVEVVFFHHHSQNAGPISTERDNTLILDLHNHVWLEQSTDGDVFTPASSTRALPYGSVAYYKIAWDKDFRESLKTWLVASQGQLNERAIPVSNEMNTSGRFARQYLFTPNMAGPFSLSMAIGDQPPVFDKTGDETLKGDVLPPQPALVAGAMNVTMQRTGSMALDDLSFWPKLRRRTDALSFKHYFDFMDWVFCGDGIADDNPINMKRLKGPNGTLAHTKKRMLPFTDTDAYRNVKAATEAFVMANCGFVGDIHDAATRDDYTQMDADFITGMVGVPTSINNLWEWLGRYLDHDSLQSPGLLPYLAVVRRKLADQPIKDQDIGDVELDHLKVSRDINNCYGLLRRRMAEPCLLELIWSYWQEEGMLVQTMNAIGRRFQNVRAPVGNDPLANLEIDPLRPLNNVLWGYIQDEQHRLSVVRRNYEYDHHYGLRLSGKAVNNMRTADSRSKFLEAFHSLLSTVSRFYRLDDDTTVKADAFPVLNALKEAHLILSQGAHNQFGDLPSTARVEMLMQQWILARPEFREFIPTRIMVAYPEPWMDRVDAMKKLQGWTDTSVLHFRNLAVFGEQVLLSIRFGNWNDVHNPLQALNWARYWRSEIQGYLHAYRSVTGIDLSLDVANARIDATMPSVHLVKRLEEQRRSA